MKSLENISSFHALTIDQLSNTLGVSPDKGLSRTEATSRLQIYGPNSQEIKKKYSFLKILLAQFINPIIYVLIIAATMAFAFGENVEGLAVVVVLLINATIGFFMEWQAQKSMDKLRNLSSTRSKVIRNERRIEIDAADIVPGDILYLEAGDLVTADARIFEEHNLAVKEAALTGESMMVEKNTACLPQDTILAERSNSLFSGTVVTRGNGKAIVAATGNNTQLGKITRLTRDAEKEATPLDKRLTHLSKRLVWLTLIITLLILLTGIAQGRNLLLIVETAIALAVAAIPEGLPVIATISLARGMLKLVKENVIVKSLRAVQTLGETDTIFTDKTGTLTENEMTVKLIVCNDLKASPDQLSAVLHNNDKTGLKKLIQVAVLCNDSTYHDSDHSARTGDPLEIALLLMAKQLGTKPEELRASFPRIEEVPFDAELKMMATLHRENSNYLICVKGATQEVLKKSSYFLQHNQPEKIEDYQYWEAQDNLLASQGLRVLSFAYKITEKKPSAKDLMENLTFIGFVCFIDPVRDGVRDAVHTCQKAGIHVVMLTGDHHETACAIAREAGLFSKNESPLTIKGQNLKDISKLSKEEILDINKSLVFSRVTPNQKLDLVHIYQQQGHIVGMTGDGVNDAPALKKAEIGIAMGQRGTEAAKEAADIILKDDAFTSIVSAIKQGRIIFENIRKFVVYLLSCNLSEILVVAAASFAGLPLPLLPLQILFLNMVTDIFPALALGMDAGEKNIMEKKPRSPKEPFVSKKHWMAILIYSLFITIPILLLELLGIYYWQFPTNALNSMTFLTLILAQLWNVFNLPERDTSFFVNEVTKNPYIWFAILLCTFIVLISWYTPFIANTLQLTALSPFQLIMVILFSLAPVLLVQFLKRGAKIIL